MDQFVQAKVMSGSVGQVRMRGQFIHVRMRGSVCTVQSGWVCLSGQGEQISLFRSG